MKLYSENKNYKLYQGSMLDMLEVIKPNSIDAIVTDPPYELNFMGKGWDNAGVSFNKDTWKKCFEVLKEGGYLLAFGGSRTYHRIACAIEDAGFEIRDCIMWLYGSGFPKSMNIGLAIDKKNGVEVKSSYIPNDKNNVYGNKFGGGKTDNTLKANNKWQGWGTCLKPSFEPIIVARKPFKGSLVDNVIKNGIGGLNIDECRVGTEERTYMSGKASNGSCFGEYNTTNNKDVTVNGRFPANTILTYDETDFDEVCGGFPITGKESSSRYFYCAKASKKDRDEGLENFEDKKFYSTLNTKNGSGERLDGGQTPIRKNTHPTVKPTELMQYLIRLIAPKNAIILDPFMGSGSTGKAVMYENKERNKNYKFIGIELTDEYLPIAAARINHVIPSVSNSEFTIDDFVNEVVY